VIQDGWVETEYRKALECDPKQIESMILLGELQFDRVYSATGTEHFVGRMKPNPHF
jgi:hypothetical protein